MTSIRCYLFMLCFTGSLAFAGETLPLRNDFKTQRRAWYKVPQAQPPATVEISVISPTEAEALFRVFREKNGIAFKYPLYGCEARASAMAIAAENFGLKLGKVFVTGHLAATIANGDYEWDWHVSVVAYVRLEDGHTELRIFEPALFDGPVSLNEFETKISGVEDVFFGSRFQYRAVHAVIAGEARKEYFKASWLTADLEHMTQRLLELSRMDEMLSSRPPFKMVPFHFHVPQSYRRVK